MVMLMLVEGRAEGKELTEFTLFNPIPIFQSKHSKLNRLQATQILSSIKSVIPLCSTKSTSILQPSTLTSTSPSRNISFTRMSSSTVDSKRPKLDIGILTHSGTHHADEALAVNLLRKLDQFKHLRKSESFQFLFFPSLPLFSPSLYPFSLPSFQHLFFNTFFFQFPADSNLNLTFSLNLTSLFFPTPTLQL